MLVHTFRLVFRDRDAPSMDTRSNTAVCLQAAIDIILMASLVTHQGSYRPSYRHLDLALSA